LTLCLVLLIGSAGNMSGALPTRTKEIYSTVRHLGWVVRDASATAQAWARLGVRDVSAPRDERFELSTARGVVPVHVKKIVAHIGTVQVDWIEPLDATGPYRAFLDAHGEGVHHVGYAAPTLAAYDAEIESFKANGAGPAASGTWTGPQGEARLAWLDTASPGGLTLELEFDPGSAGPPPASRNDDPFNRVTQFAFVVRDVAAVSRHFERLGYAPLAIEPNLSLDRVYRGAPGAFEMLLGWGRTGTVPFEWIQPTKGPSVYEEYLEAHGEGFHHLGLDVTDMDAALARLRDRGLAVTMSGAWDVNGYQGRFAYLDTDRFGGVTIELLWNKPRP